MKILLLEDDVALNKSIRTLLKTYEHNVLSFTDGEMAIDAIDNSIDLYILDINVEGIDGLEVLDAIRQYDKDVPVIMASANIEIETIMTSYTQGCNDYLKKPFDVRELKLKIEQYSATQDQIIILGDSLEFDLKRSTLHFQQKPVKLTQKELILLKTLVKQKGYIVEYSEIIDEIWGDDAAFASMDSLRSIAARLRQKIPSDIITSHMGMGYSIEI